MVVLAEGLDMFRLGAVATGEMSLLSGNWSFAKKKPWMHLNPERLGSH
jgi:hypothetical protein